MLFRHIKDHTVHTDQAGIHFKLFLQLGHGESEGRAVRSHDKKVVRPSQRREMAQRAVAEFGMCIRVASATFSISETCYRYQQKRSGDNALIADWLVRLKHTLFAVARIPIGFSRLSRYKGLQHSLSRSAVLRAIAIGHAIDHGFK